MLVHPDVHFTVALADHRETIETNRQRASHRRQDDQTTVQAQPKRNRRKQLRIAHS